MHKGARTDPCGGRGVTRAPTATDARVGVDGVDPSRPVAIRTCWFAERIEWVECLHSEPWLPDRRVPNCLIILQRHRVAPIDLADEDQVGALIVGRAIPFRAPAVPGQKWTGLSVEKGASAFSTWVTGTR
jgi:hypothetical protein